MDPLHGDLDTRVAVDTAALAWEASPSASVWRKRVHRVGPAESGQVTSVVRYEPGSTFPAHDHPDGEEILVLAGVFSDEHGDWPAGSYLVNPEGFRHAPFSREGCEIFVKLRQLRGAGRAHVAVQTDSLPWQDGEWPGVEVRGLYAQRGFADTVRLERWAPATQLGAVAYPGGAEFFVLEGAFSDEHGAHTERTWIRQPVGSSHTPRTTGGCVVYVKRGGLGQLDAAPGSR